MLVDGFVAAGVRDVVISPGSRSTPFVWAVDQRPELSTWDIVDERSAAFFALGQAKRSSRPSLLLSTSGSAVANYLPAIVEAASSYTPLLVLTADRPPWRAWAGSNQTIDQLKIFGDQVRGFFELGSPDPSDRALAALRRIAVQATALAERPVPGPVHLNAPLRRPLEPRTKATSEDERELAERIRRLEERPAPRSWGYGRSPDDEAIDRLASTLSAAERGLVVCGPAAPAASATRDRLIELSTRASLAIYAEATSQYRFRAASVDPPTVFFDGLDLALRIDRFVERMEPDLVLQIGTGPVSASWQRLSDRGWGGERWVLAEHGWQDPSSTAHHHLIGDLDRTLDALLRRLPEAPSPPRTAWTTAMERCAEAVARSVDAAPDTDELTEASAVRAFVDGLPDGALLGLGNSLPVREIDWFVGGAGRDLTVWHQRGTSGIDGVVSGFCGAASRHDGPGALLIGDLSLLHDLGGVGLLTRLGRSATVVVLNNHGGRIFEQLPLAATETGQSRVFEHWTTPHDLGFESIAGMHGLPYRRPATTVELLGAVREAMAGGSGSLIEVEVPADSARRALEQLRRRVGRAIADCTEG